MLVAILHLATVAEKDQRHFQYKIRDYRFATYFHGTSDGNSQWSTTSLRMQYPLLPSFMLARTKSKVWGHEPLTDEKFVLTRPIDEDLIKYGLEEDVW